MSTLLITGAAGFIGARTAQLALDAGHQVVGVDNLNDYYDPRINLEREMNRRWTQPSAARWTNTLILEMSQMDIDFKKLLNNWSLTLRVKLTINPTL